MITPEQVRFFNDNGYLIIRGLLPTSEVDALRAEADRLQADALAKVRQSDYLAGAKFLSRDWIENPTDGYVYRQKADGAYSFHRAERMFRREPLWSQMAMSPRLLSVVWSVLAQALLAARRVAGLQAASRRGGGPLAPGHPVPLLVQRRAYQ